VGLFDQAKISQRSEADVRADNGPVHRATRREHPRHARKALLVLDARATISSILLKSFATWSSGERAEGKACSRSRLGRAGDEARELLPWTAGPGAQKNFDPEHPLARDSKGRRLALLLYSCLIQFVSCRPASHYVSRTHCRSPAVPHARALACMSVMVEVVKGAKFLHEVH